MKHSNFDWDPNKDVINIEKLLLARRKKNLCARKL